MQNQTFTITFGDQAENHVGMQKIGQEASEGFTLQDLKRARNWFRERGAQYVLYNLKELLPPEIVNTYPVEDAYILVIPKGLDYILRPEFNSNNFFQEQEALEKDTQAYMYGRVVNKKARYNLCFGSQDQEPDYPNGKGRIISFERVPLLSRVRTSFPEIIGDKGNNLVAEGNYYYDINKCYIGYHGDSERYKVIAIRVGATFPLHYQWYYESKPYGSRGEVMLNHGDIYFMSEKATGRDWKRRSIFTLRHAAGNTKYLK